MDIHIRRFIKEDLSDLYALLSSEKVMRYLEAPFSLKKTEAFLDRYALSLNPSVYALECDGSFAGYVIWNSYDPDSMEIGWVLSEAYWNKGVASSITEKMIKKADALKKDLVLECVKEQVVSEHIAKKYGFAYEGTRDGLKVYRRHYKK